jgi:phage-related protein
MTDTFIYVPSYTSAMQVVPRVLSAKFGDGYSQRTPDGLNTMLRKWTILFNNCPKTECDAIESFFIAHGGYLSFNWNPPTGLPGLWICGQPDGWKRTPQAGPLSSITCTFEEVMA